MIPTINVVTKDVSIEFEPARIFGSDLFVMGSCGWLLGLGFIRISKQQQQESNGLTRHSLFILWRVYLPGGIPLLYGLLGHVFGECQNMIFEERGHGEDVVFPHECFLFLSRFVA